MNLPIKSYGLYDFGSADTLTECISSSSDLTETQVLIKVKSTSVNPIDIKTRQGLGYVAQNKGAGEFLPLGYDLYGEVVSVGGQVKTCQVGQYVIGMIGFPQKPGSYANYVIAEQNELIVVSENENSAVSGLCLAGLTALQALKLFPKEDAPLYINAITGGVGHLAAQIAKIQGRDVIGISNRPDHPLLQSMGMQCITSTRFTEERRAGHVLDLVGGEIGLSLLEAMSSDSFIVTVPSITKEAICMAARDKGIHACGMLVNANAQELSYLYQLYKEQLIDVASSKIFGLSEVASAHRYCEQGQHFGKVILQA